MPGGGEQEEPPILWQVFVPSNDEDHNRQLADITYDEEYGEVVEWQFSAKPAYRGPLWNLSFLVTDHVILWRFIFLVLL